MTDTDRNDCELPSRHNKKKMMWEAGRIERWPKELRWQGFVKTTCRKGEGNHLTPTKAIILVAVLLLLLSSSE